MTISIISVPLTHYDRKLTEASGEYVDFVEIKEDDLRALKSKAKGW